MNELQLKRARAKAKANAALAVEADTQDVQQPEKIMPAGPPQLQRKTPQVSFGQHLRASIAQPEDKIARYAQMMKRPTEEFGVIDGEIVHWDGRKYNKVVPDVVGDPVDMFYNVGSNVAASTGPAVPAVASGATGAVTKSPAVAAATGGIVNMVLQAADKWLAGEEVATTDYNLVTPAVDAALGAGGQWLGNAATAMFTRNRAGVAPWDKLKAMDPAMLNNAEELQRMAAQDFGIDLSLGQATGLRSMLMRERQAARWPETADDVADMVRRQNETQFPEAIGAATRSLSPLGGEEAVRAFRAGGEDVVNKALKARSVEADAAYKIAYDANKDLTSPTLNRLLKTSHGAQALREARLEMADRMKAMAVPDAELTQQMRVLADIGKIDRVSPGVAKGLKLETWDLIKRKLWDIEQGMINPATHKPTSAGAAVKNVRQKLTKELDRLDKSKIAGPNSTYPGPGAYQKARMQFGDASEQVEIILKGGPGIVQRMKGIDHAKLMQGMFSESRMTVEEVTRARQAYYATGNRKAWDAGVASWMDDVLNKAQGVTMNADASNVAGKVYKSVYGTPNQRAITKAALGDESFDVFDKLMDVLNHARKSLPEGSPTASDIGAMAPDVVSSTVGVAAKPFNMNTIANLGDTAAHTVMEVRQPEARRRLMEILLSGNIGELRKLRMINPATENGVRVAADALLKAGVLSGASAMAPRETRAAPAASKRPIPLLPQAAGAPP